MTYAIKASRKDSFFCGFDENNQPLWGGKHEALWWENKTHAEAQALLIDNAQRKPVLIDRSMTELLGQYLIHL